MKKYSKWFTIRLNGASVQEVKKAILILMENLSMVSAFDYEKGKFIKFKTTDVNYGYYLITLIVRDNPKMFVRTTNH